MFKNWNLETIITPVNPNSLKSLLEEVNFNQAETDFLVDGFSHGFDLGYRGPGDIKQKAPNLKFTIGNETELWNKVMKEVELGRYAGPFESIPFNEYIQSPIGLVPKDKGTKTRLIFHLSYPRKTEPPKSVNGNTPEDLTHVVYPSFDDAVRLCIKAGKGCTAAKSDMSSAFRHFPINPKFWKYLVMKARNPNDGKWYYFIDKCMPFGASISCSHFQRFSNAIAFLVEQKTKKENINYLDDYFFVDYFKVDCNNQVKVFLTVCQTINFPVSKEKTFWGTTRLSFLGLLIDTILEMIFIPIDKLERAKSLIEHMLNKPNKKTTLRELQKLTGFLNFLSKAIVPGRAFTRRFYTYGKPDMQPHHHLYINKEMKEDLQTWLTFLEHPNIYGRKFIDFDRSISSIEINMFSDASANPNLGCGGISDDEWFLVQWNKKFINTKKPSINYLELYGVTCAVMCWIHKYKNKRIILFCDNTSVVHMINNNSSKCKNCMALIRLIVLQGLIHNVKINAEHVPGVENIFSDRLSRLKYNEFRQEARKRNIYFKGTPTKIPDILWPMDKLWVEDYQTDI